MILEMLETIEIKDKQFKMNEPRSKNIDFDMFEYNWLEEDE